MKRVAIRFKVKRAHRRLFVYIRFPHSNWTGVDGPVYVVWAPGGGFYVAHPCRAAPTEVNMQAQRDQKHCHRESYTGSSHGVPNIFFVSIAPILRMPASRIVAVAFSQATATSFLLFAFLNELFLC